MTRYQCTTCGKRHRRLLSRCPGCLAWHTVEEVEGASPSSLLPVAPVAKGGFPPSAGNGLISIANVLPIKEPRISTGLSEVDRVLGGGLVKGTVSLLGGAPGSGKSTLSLQIGHSIADLGRQVVYVSGEESSEQARIRADRIGAVHPSLLLLPQTDIDQALQIIQGASPGLLIVDSIQTLYTPEIKSPPGSTGQLRECTARLVAYARSSRTPVILIGHVTKENVLAGPRILEHMVDTVLYLEGREQESNCRVLRASKGRYADTSEVGIFRMREDGLHAVPDPTTAFLPQGIPGPGSVLTVALEGERAILVEIQALVGPEKKGQGRRSIVGMDSSRVQLIEAVLSFQGVDLSKHDIFLTVSGGYELHKPEADLAVLLAILSSWRKEPLVEGAHVVAFGEISLNGAIRQTPGAERRQGAAGRYGYQTVWSVGEFATLRVSHVSDLV